MDVIAPLGKMEARPALLRQLGVVSATALVVSNMIGTGIFTTTGFLAGDLGSPSLVLWIWVVGAACALVGAMCYSELGVNLPSSGGEYVYLTEAFGPTWGFMTGWVSFFAGFSAPIAAAALAFSGYVGYFFPSTLPDHAPAFAGHGDWTFRLGGAQWMACALVVVFTILNVLGVQRAARVQNILTAVKVAVIVSFIGLGFLAGHGEMREFFAPRGARYGDTCRGTIRDQLVLDLRGLQRLERSHVRGGGAASSPADAPHRSGNRRGSGGGAVHRIEPGVHLRGAAERFEGATGGGGSGRIAFVRAQDRRNFQRADGAFSDGHGERHGDHRAAGLLRHREKRRVSRPSPPGFIPSGTLRWLRLSRSACAPC